LKRDAGLIPSSGRFFYSADLSIAGDSRFGGHTGAIPNDLDMAINMAAGIDKPSLASPTHRR